MNPRHIRSQLRRARRLAPSVRFLWREGVVRRHTTERYRLRATGQLVTLRHRSSDLSCFDEIEVKGIYDMPEPWSILAQSSRPVRVVDLGANIGLFGLKFLEHHPDARIVAFEPDQTNAAVLRATIAANNLGEQWKVVEACAGTRDGSVLFQSGHFMESKIADNGTPTLVRDAFPALQEADAIKIDIEGAEGDLLADSRFTHLAAHVLWLEYHPPHTRETVLRSLRAASFEPGPIVEGAGGHGELWARKRS